MRIGIAGHAGAGKTTLARALAAELGARYIEDFTLELLREQKGEPTWRGIRDTRIRRTIRMTALDQKIAAESAAASFVSDKTVVDYLAYWFRNQSEFETPQTTLTFLERVKEHLPRYDVCVFLTYREDVDWEEGRSTDPVHNLDVAALKRGLLQMLGVHVVDAPYTFGEDMAAWVARWLPSGGKAAGQKPARARSANKKASARKKAPGAKKASARKKTSARKKRS